MIEINRKSIYIIRFAANCKLFYSIRFDSTFYITYLIICSFLVVSIANVFVIVVSIGIALDFVGSENLIIEIVEQVVDGRNIVEETSNESSECELFGNY